MWCGLLKDEDGTTFSYSAGVRTRCGVPEIQGIGLKQPIAHVVVNAFNTQLRCGDGLVHGPRRFTFLQAFSVPFEAVLRHASARTGKDLGREKWPYRGISYKAPWNVWPSTPMPGQRGRAPPAGSASAGSFPEIL